MLGQYTFRSMQSLTNINLDNEINMQLGNVGKLTANSKEMICVHINIIITLFDERIVLANKLFETAYISCGVKILQTQPFLLAESSNTHPYMEITTALLRLERTMNLLCH